MMHDRSIFFFFGSIVKTSVARVRDTSLVSNNRESFTQFALIIATVFRWRIKTSFKSRHADNLCRGVRTRIGESGEWRRSEKLECEPYQIFRNIL